MSDRVVIFLHLPKTAGSTLKRVLAQQYPAEAIHQLGGKSPEVVAREVAEVTRPPARARLLSGHCYFGVHATAACDFTYITVLRDPVERLLSHFYYAQRLPSHSHHADIASGRLTLRGMAEMYGNLQTRSLADQSVRGVAAAPAETLASAKANVERHFSVVGLAERFDETLLLFQRRLGWKIGAVANRNVSHGRPAGSAHSAEDLAAIRAVNALDLDLYEWVRARFAAEVAAAGLGFHAGLAWLRVRNRALVFRRKLSGANS